MNSLLIESFPRMWDQQRRRSVDDCPDRIIPTYVGSTSLCIKYARSAANHSHVCGINVTEQENNINQYESFPRMWDQLT